MSPKGEADPFSLPHKTPSSAKPRCYLILQKLPATSMHPAKRKKENERRERKRRRESENLSRYTLALPLTLCLTCNQNNSNPVTVCISAKFLNFSSRQQALGMTACLSDSSRICQSPSAEATGKLNASEQGRPCTFPWARKAASWAPHPGRDFQDPHVRAPA